MANDFVEILSPKALSDLKEANQEILTLISNMDKVGVKMKGASTPSGTNKAVSDLTAQYKQQEQTILSLQNKIQKLTQQQNALNASNTQLVSGQRRVTNASREQTIASQIQRNEADRNFRANTLLAGAYAKASAQLLVLKKEAKDAAITFGEQSVQAKRAAAAANELGGRIIAADKVVGDYQRNVGNYSNGVIKGFQGIFANVRQLAYILPGIGIAGIFGLIGEGIMKVFTKSSEALDKFKENVSDVVSTTTEKAVTLKAVSQVINDTSSSQEQLNAALKVAKQEGISLNAIEEARKGNLELINIELDKQIELSIKKAKADKLVNLIAENEIEQTKNLRKEKENYNAWYRQALRFAGKYSKDAALQEAALNKMSLNDISELKKENAEYYKMLKELGLENLLDENKNHNKKVKAKKEQEQYDQNSITALENQIKNLEEIRGKIDASSYAYSLLDFQVKILENTLKAMKGEFTLTESIIKPEMVIDGDAVALEIDKAKKNVVALSKDLEKILNDAYGYSNELGQNFRGSFDGLTKEQQNKFKELAAQYAEALDNGDKETADSIKLRLDLYNAYGNTIANYQKSFVDSFVGGSGFQNTFKILNKEIEGFGENAKVTALAVGESFQEMFNFISQFGQENFDAERKRLEEEKQIAIAFAGDSQTAKDEINRQAEEKARQLRRREFEAKKQQAVFNIAIDTAQAIAATLGKTGFFGIPLTYIVAALGLAQIAAVNAQEVPAYKDGTENHKGGLMLVNDGSGSNYKETIVTPDGKAYQPKERNVFMNAPKGTKVFTHDQWQKNLDNILTSNSINYAQPNVIVNSGMSDEQVDRIVSTIANKQESHLSLDKSGIKQYISQGHTQKEILNSHVTFGR